jgi:hypothetical protein
MHMPETPMWGTLLARLRSQTELTATQTARLFNISREHLYRLQKDEVEWSGACLQILRVLLACRLGDFERLLADLLSPPGSAIALDTDQLLASKCRRALATFHHCHDDHRRVGDLLLQPGGTPARPGRWVYWATSARADAEETAQLARTHHFICRPFLSSRFVMPAYLNDVRPKDLILLVHDGTPLGWFKVKRSRQNDSRAGVPHLPPVYKFVKARSSLGRRLEALGYRNQKGASPAGSDEPFSGLHVEPHTGEPLPPHLPSKPADVEDALTPLEAVVVSTKRRSQARRLHSSPHPPS